MTRLLVLCLVVAISVSEGYAASLRFKRQLVPREFQNINIENYLKNERAVRFQLKCIIDDGPCDRIGKYLKVTIPELLVNQCANCDNAQRERAGKLVSHIQQNFPSDWERAVKKFQGGLVKPEDAERLENLLGVKLDPKLVGPTTTTTAAPVETTPVAKAAEVPSTSEVPIASSSAAPAASSTSSEAPASSSAAPEATSAASAAPVESTSVAAAVSEASSTVAAVSSTSESAAVVSTSEAAAPASSTAAAVASSSAAPAA